MSGIKEIGETINVRSVDQMVFKVTRSDWNKNKKMRLLERTASESTIRSASKMLYNFSVNIRAGLTDFVV